MTQTEVLVKRGEEELLTEGFAQPGDRVVLVFGAPIAAVVSQTNSIRLHEIMRRSGDGSGTD